VATGSCYLLSAYGIRPFSVNNTDVWDRAARAGYLFALSCLGLIWAGLAAFHTVLNTLAADAFLAVPPFMADHFFFPVAFFLVSR
jgi:hypothetical protein